MTVKCYNRGCGEWREDSTGFKVNNHCPSKQDVTKCSRCIKDKGEVIMTLKPCLNSKCSKYDSSLSTHCGAWDTHRFKSDRMTINTQCDRYVGGGLLSTAKSVATSIKTTIKPYEKYIGLVALAVVIDHFLLDGKYAHKFKELAEAIVEKITTGLSNLTTKLSDAWFTDTDVASQETQEGEDN